MPRPRAKVAATAYDGIIVSIFTGKIGAGEALPEDHLVELFGGSRTSVRDALAALEADGLVEQKTKATARVRPAPRTAEVMRSQESRFIMEMFSGLGLIRLLNEGGASLERIESLHKQMVTMAKNEAKQPGQLERQKAEFLIQDIQFHLAVSQEAGYHQFVSPLNQVLHSVRLHSLPIFQGYEQLNEVVAQHAAIVDALRERDPAAYIAALTAHLDAATFRWLGPEVADWRFVDRDMEEAVPHYEAAKEARNRLFQEYTKAERKTGRQ